MNVFSPKSVISQWNTLMCVGATQKEVLEDSIMVTKETLLVAKLSIEVHTSISDWSKEYSN